MSPPASIDVPDFDVPLSDASSLGTLVRTEWLLTSGHGAYAMGTALGVRRRRYHGLLVAATLPPVGRVLALASLDAALVLPDDGDEGGPRRVRLGADELAEHGLRLPEVDGFDFHHAGAPVWHFRAGGVTITATVTLADGRNAVAVRYEAMGVVPEGARLEIRPMVALRDAHGILEGGEAFTAELLPASRGLVGHAVSRGPHRLEIATTATTTARCMLDPALGPPLLYAIERDRGQSDTERLYCPGAIDIDLTKLADRAEGLIVHAALHAISETDDAAASPPTRVHRIAAAVQRTIEAAPQLAPLRQLLESTDDFLVDRDAGGRRCKTVIAGYPWFADWGRDTMIALPGLLLVPRRFDDAFACLAAFASHVSEGMIPNRFDDDTNEPHYNTVDASLWFLHAAKAYLDASGDRVGYLGELRPACLEIIERYRAGTRFGIHADPADGLIVAGDETTQLTWMDALRDGVVFTPRHGKVVEINALWHHGLLCTARAIDDDDPNTAKRLRTLAEEVRAGFRRSFLDGPAGGLVDCLRPDGAGGFAPTDELRPNQIFAVSLEHTTLERPEQQRIVSVVQKHLLTSRGLRTLARSDPGYRGRFEGDMVSRDAAYHNGTVWPWLMGPFCEALLRAHEFDERSRTMARAAIQPLLRTLDEGCRGHIAEVYDGDCHLDRRPIGKGCTAQAWSLAEPLRVAALLLQ